MTQLTRSKTGKRSAILHAACGALACFSVLAPSHAQTNGTWIGGSGSWTTGPWSNSPAFPNNGGVATFRPRVVGSADVTLDGTFTLSKLDVSSVPVLGFSGAGSINLVGPAEIRNDVALPTFYQAIWYQQGPLLGHLTGTAGFTKTGAGAIILDRPSSFAGDVRIQQGTLEMRQTSDVALGQASNRIVFDGGELTDPYQFAPQFVVNRPIYVDAGGGRIIPQSLLRIGIGPLPGRLTGVINGFGPLRLDAPGYASTLGLEAKNTLTGPLTFGGTGTILLSAAGSIRQSSSVRVDGGKFFVDYGMTIAGVADADRIGNAAPLTIGSGTFGLLGNATLSVNESVGTINVTNRAWIVAKPNPSGTSSVTLTAAALERAPHSAVRFEVTPTRGAIKFSQAPVLTGGGGASGNTNVSVLPYAYAWNTSGEGSHVTYDPATGVRALTPSEYMSSLPGATDPTDRNVRLSSQVVTTPRTVNALAIFPTTVLSGSATLTIASGAVVTGIGTYAAVGGRISCPLEFGTREAFIAGGGTLSGSMHGSGGLTLHDGGYVITGASSTYTGRTTIHGTTLKLLANVPASGPGPLGTDTSAVHLTHGSAIVLGNSTDPAGTTYSFDRPISIDAVNERSQVRLASADEQSEGAAGVFNGDIYGERSQVYLEGPSLTFNGTISGDARFIPYMGTVTFNGNNTYTGGTEISYADVRGGSDQAFGSGPIYLLPNARLRASGGARRFANALYAQNGTILDGPAITFTGPIQVNNGGGLRSESNSDVIIEGGIDGSGIQFEARGSGAIRLRGANSHIGETGVRAGTLYVEHPLALGSTDIGTEVSTEGRLRLAAGVAVNGEPLRLYSTLFDLTATVNSQLHGSGGGYSAWNGPIVVLDGYACLGVDATGTLTVASLKVPPNRGLDKTGGGTLIVPRLSLQEIRVAAGTAVFATSSPSNQSSKTFRVTLGGPGSTLDLSDNDLHITGGNTLADVEAKVRAAYHFGAWDGAGIASSTARDNSIGNTTLGVMSGQQFIDNSGGNVFDGNTVNATDVLVKYTYFGDVDFNGAIDASDYNLIDFGFVSHLTGWAFGDADLSGAVDVSDYNVIDFAFVTQNGSVLRAMSYLEGYDRSMKGMNDDPSLQLVVEHFAQFGEEYRTGFLSHVPEPMSIGALSVASIVLARRRRHLT